MNRIFFIFGFTCFSFAFAQVKLNSETATKLSKLPLHCISNEFPNKTGHLSDKAEDHKMLPSELHPVFFGCLDWHSSVHGHWMLVKLLKDFPELENKNEIFAQLELSFQKEKIEKEAEYFGKYTSSNNFERTYGWAWLLKLDQELLEWKHPKAKIWRENLQPLTQKIIKLWKAYLPKQTYPNRSGMHANTAFGLGFAYDWALASKDTEFLEAIKAKAKIFYLNNQVAPAFLEPDGADFFSPSLQIADLMTRILPKKNYITWIKNFYDKKGIDRICESVTVSDRADYQTVHLDGLALSRAWCMKVIAEYLPKNSVLRVKFERTGLKFLEETLPQIFNGGYGGEHWLASFAVYALNKYPK